MMDDFGLYPRDEQFDPFSVMLFKALQVVAFFFFIALLSISPDAKDGKVDSKAEFIITMDWPDNHPDDLDLFGPGSLYQRISVAHTRYGRARLAEFIAEPAEPGEERARQEAVAELSPKLELRQAFEAEAMALTERGTKSERQNGGPDPARLIAWAEKGPELPGGLLTTLLSFLLPACWPVCRPVPTPSRRSPTPARSPSPIASRRCPSATLPVLASRSAFRWTSRTRSSTR